jgi:hypothetical protein
VWKLRNADVNEEGNEPSDLFDWKTIHLNNYKLSKEIYQLLKFINPLLNSPDISTHFHELLTKLISQTELMSIDFQIRMRKICADLEECISNSKATIFLYDPVREIITNGSAPSMPKTFFDFYREFNKSANKISAPFEYDIRISDISQDPRWRTYYHHFSNIGIKSCWTIPIYRTSNIISSLAIYSHNGKPPVSKELNCIQEQKKRFNRLLQEYPAEFPSLWQRNNLIHK